MAMFKKILIANRGEIATRIMRACREMDIETVSVYSQADEHALHVMFAGEAVCIGKASPKDTYLNVDAILTVAMATGCDAVHPGYGFLSENSDFARKCEEAGITFIGPSGDIIDKMGNKSAARTLMESVGVPVVPGSKGAVETPEDAVAIAREIGYPILVKAAAGGGGRGMRRVYSEDTMESLFLEARAESMACFGDGEMYLEKLILKPRHIEFQILADKFGNVIQLGERDCSIQRKNQKMMEESPSHSLPQEMREKMGQAAVLAAKAANYVNAGTIEFVVGQDNQFYFIEMNTRIQVEHPVTEMRTGVDLIRQQIRIAAGLPLDLTQEDVVMKGHAIECRINVEDPQRNFAPCPGTVDFLYFPGGFGTRVDTYLYQGYQIPPFYDSMVAKIIVTAPTRRDAIRRMRRALEELTVDGITTTAPLLHQILYHPEFVSGKYHTGFMEDHLDTILGWLGKKD